VKRLNADKGYAASYRKAARSHAMKFDWKEIAEQVSVVYVAATNGQSPADALARFNRKS
jgi:hypothetical protein